jgi:hypothetical protein
MEFLLTSRRTVQKGNTRLFATSAQKKNLPQWRSTLRRMYPWLYCHSYFTRMTAKLKSLLHR